MFCELAQRNIEASGRAAGGQYRPVAFRGLRVRGHNARTATAIEAAIGPPMRAAISRYAAR